MITIINYLRMIMWYIVCIVFLIPIVIVSGFFLPLAMLIDGFNNFVNCNMSYLEWFDFVLRIPEKWFEFCRKMAGINNENCN